MAEKRTDAARIAELEADNQRLRRLLDQRDAPGELRHRLRSTVAMLRTIIRKSARTKRDIDAYVAHVEDRLDALMRAQAAADERGAVGIYKLLTDELFHYGASEGERLHLSGPVVELRPRAGQVFSLAVHELAVNAVEHGVLGARTGRIAIAWTVEREGEGLDPVMTFIWKETGAAPTEQPFHQGFGREVITRVVAYELKADTSLAFEPDGLRCTIRFPLSEGIGRVVGG